MIHHLQVLSILSVHLFILIGNVWTGTENKNHLKPVTLLHTVRKRFLTQNRNIYTPFTETVKIHLDNVNTNNDYPVMFPCLDLCPSAPPHSLNYPEFNSFDPIHNGVDAENEFELQLQNELRRSLEKEFAQELQWQNDQELLNNELLKDDDLIFLFEL